MVLEEELQELARTIGLSDADPILQLAFKRGGQERDWRLALSLEHPVSAKSSCDLLRGMPPAPPKLRLCRQFLERICVQGSGHGGMWLRTHHTHRGRSSCADSHHPSLLWVATQGRFCRPWARDECILWALCFAPRNREGERFRVDLLRRILSDSLAEQIGSADIREAVHTRCLLIKKRTKGGYRGDKNHQQRNSPPPGPSSKDHLRVLPGGGNLSPPPLVDVCFHTQCRHICIHMW